MNIIQERVAILHIKKAASDATGIASSVLSVRKRKYGTDIKRLTSWLLYYYTDLSLNRIAECCSIDHASVLFNVRKLNGLIETSHIDAINVLKAEHSIEKLGLVKKNRSHREICLEEIKYPIFYKKPSSRPVPTTKRAEKIILASNNRQVTESILRKKREQINGCMDIDDVIVLAKEIKELETALQHIK